MIVSLIFYKFITLIQVYSLEQLVVLNKILICSFRIAENLVSAHDTGECS